MSTLTRVAVLSIYVLLVKANDQCRLTSFSDQMEHRSLEGHVIRVTKATDDLHCQLLCSIEGACSSFNLGPRLGGEHICELSNSDHSQHPENLGNRAGFAYRYAVTNLCGGVKCLYNASCEVVQGKPRPQCLCPAGYTGGYCNIDINECASNPCENGGSCTDAVNDYSCACSAGWTGKECTIDIDECARDPCVNGNCIDEPNGYTCSCAAGWTGLHCAAEIDECASNPCRNGGVCSDALNKYTCACAAGWTGLRCETDIDECVSNPCQNGGTCTDALNSYTCACAPGWAGVHCETGIDECASNPCQNGGTCVDAVNGYTCVCVAGWTGADCNKKDLWDFDTDLSGFSQDSADDIDWIRLSGSTPSPGTGPTKDHSGQGHYLYLEATNQTPRDEAKLKKTITLSGNSCLKFFYHMYGEHIGTLNVSVDEHTVFLLSGNQGNKWKYFRTHLSGVGNKELVFRGIIGAGWSGDVAIDDVYFTDCYDADECASNPCQNGGVCSDHKETGYTCYCTKGWSGEQCTQGLCLSYEQLTDSTRHRNYGHSDTHCDKSTLVEQWYRFTGSAGTQMATSCPATNHCNTHAPGWLTGPHPTVEEGVVTRTVCYHWLDNCCHYQSTIRVLNCGPFYIYDLVLPPYCYLRYCGE